MLAVPSFFQNRYESISEYFFMQKQMEDGEDDVHSVKLHLKSGGYITKRNGHLVTIRPHKQGVPLEFGLGLLGKALQAPFLKRSSSASSSSNLEHTQSQQHAPNDSVGFQTSMAKSSTGDTGQPVPEDSGQPKAQPQQEQLFSLRPNSEMPMAPHGYGPYQPLFYGRNNVPMVLVPIPGAHHNSNRHGMGGIGYGHLMLPPPTVENNNYRNTSNGNWPPYYPEWIPSPLAHQGPATTRHVCAGCGRERSRKYHHEHPIVAGAPPISGLCRKCQKEATSTDESSDSHGSDIERRLGGKKKGRKSKSKSERASKKDKVRRKTVEH